MPQLDRSSSTRERCRSMRVLVSPAFLRDLADIVRLVGPVLPAEPQRAPGGAPGRQGRAIRYAVAVVADLARRGEVPGTADRDNSG